MEDMILDHSSSRCAHNHERCKDDEPGRRLRQVLLTSMPQWLVTAATKNPTCSSQPFDRPRAAGSWPVWTRPHAYRTSSLSKKATEVKQVG
ncbi:hypothetical protein Taro_030788, partial [Colocasia esculenta]|nr:hypothetical protein [Colocasia esculenta]